MNDDRTNFLHRNISIQVTMDETRKVIDHTSINDTTDLFWVVDSREVNAIVPTIGNIWEIVSG